MSEAHSLPPSTHNNPPITAPVDQDVLQDLQTRFPELDEEMTQIEADLKTYPNKLTLADEATAKALQDLIGKMKKLASKLKAYKASEKKPWDGVVKVVQNFFTGRQEKVSGLLETWEGGVYEDYLQQVKSENLRKAEAEAEKQREIAVQAERDREAADRRAAEARQREEDARRAEQEARERAAAEEARAKAAREEAERAEAEERRLAAERKERERAEKETNADSLKKIRIYMKEADRLNAAIMEAGDEAPEASIQQLDALIKAGGIVSLLAGPVSGSNLLDEGQAAQIEEVKGRINDLRKAVGDRLDAKERRKREKARKEEEARDAAETERRRVAREEDERLSREAREARERAEREADEARAAQRAAQGDAREARGEQRSAFSEQKVAAKDAGKAGEVADRAENRADRIDRKLDNSTDADLSRTRGDLGTVGGLRRAWKHYLPEDETALRATCGILGPHFTTEAVNGAVFKIMRIRQASFTGERVEPADLPGVVFAYESDANVRT